MKITGKEVSGPAQDSARNGVPAGKTAKIVPQEKNSPGLRTGPLNRVPPAKSAGSPAAVPGRAVRSPAELSQAARQGLPEAKGGGEPRTVIGETRLRDLLDSLKPDAGQRLPADDLSKNLVSFMRYFSLPLSPKLIGSLRREALSRKNRDAAALAAAAAADKGVRLSGEALKEYAAAIAGDFDETGDKAGGDENGGENNGGNGENRQNNQNSGEKPQTSAERRKMENSPPDRSEIQRKVTGILDKKPLLPFLNAIPGKNGRRWIVLPFSFSRDGMDFNVSMRISLAEKLEIERFTAEITLENPPAEKPEKKERRWLFILDKPETAEARAVLSAPPDKAGRNLTREFAKAMNLEPDRIFLKDQCSFADSRDELLRFIDKEV